MVDVNASNDTIVIGPQPGPQTEFLQSSCDLTFYGGGAGGGKTYGMLLAHLPWIQTPGYRGAFFRRTRPELTDEGGVWDESMSLYSLCGGVPSVGKLKWTFEPDAVIGFKSCQHDKDVLSYKGMQVDLLQIDQAEEFTEKQFWYLQSRNRGRSGIRSYCHASYNPQPGWLADFVSWWWDPITGYARQDRAGIVRWFSRINNQVYWADTRDELQNKFGHIPDFKPTSCTFIPATADDNPINLKNNPDYKARLLAMRHVEMERLLRGNHLIRDDEECEWPSEYFMDIWVDELPHSFELSAIFVDASKGRSEKSDYSAIVFAGLQSGVLYLDCDLARRPCPQIIEDAATMAADYRPEAVGFESDQFQELLCGDFERYVAEQGHFPVNVVPQPTHGVNKQVRIRRLGVWLKQGRLKFLRSPGASLAVQQTQGFPLEKHDDGPDAIEGAVRLLNSIAREIMDESNEDYALRVAGV